MRRTGEGVEVHAAPAGQDRDGGVGSRRERRVPRPGRRTEAVDLITESRRLAPRFRNDENHRIDVLLAADGTLPQ